MILQYVNYSKFLFLFELSKMFKKWNYLQNYEILTKLKLNFNKLYLFRKRGIINKIDKRNILKKDVIFKELNIQRFIGENVRVSERKRERNVYNLFVAYYDCIAIPLVTFQPFPVFPSRFLHKQPVIPCINHSQLVITKDREGQCAEPPFLSSLRTPLVSNISKIRIFFCPILNFVPYI